MCGIAGIISKSGVKPQVLQNMSNVLRHRGPDDEGFWLNNSENQIQARGKDTISELSYFPHIERLNQANFDVGLVHRRLSIIDLSANGHQPMCENSGKIIITFNGEIYNYIDCLKLGKERLFKCNKNSS